MKLPNIDHAFIEDAKIRDYLLSGAHPVGRFKAAFFISLGYTQNEWTRLRDDFLALARKGEALPGGESGFGRKFEVSGMLTGPSGRSVEVLTIWIVGADGVAPRFVTAYPR